MSGMKVWASFVLAMLVVSCATQYTQNSVFGGYSDTKIDETHYQVKFDGNGHSSQERVWSFWIYRCAELTKQKGFVYFALEKPGPKVSAMPDAARRSFASYSEEDVPAKIRTAGATYTPIYIPGARITTWHTNAIVAMYNDPTPEGVIVLRAQSVLDDLDPYVKSNGAGTPIAKDVLFRHAAMLRRPATDYNLSGTL